MKLSILALLTYTTATLAFTSSPKLSTSALTTFNLQSTTSFRAAHQNSSIPYENLPWYLSNIEVFESSELLIPGITNQARSYVVFNITDKNPDLEFNTLCKYSALRGVSKAATPGDVYVECEDDIVGFKFDGTRISIVRSYSYASPSAPNGREFVLCYGNWNTSLHEFPNRAPAPPGLKRVQGCMEIYCTEMSG